MTQDDFIKAYYEYHTFSEQEAVMEVVSANAKGIDNDIAVIVRLGEAEYGLMLKSIIEFLAGFNDG